MVKLNSLYFRETTARAVTTAPITIATANAGVTFDDTSIFSKGMSIFIGDGTNFAYYEVTTVVNSTTMDLTKISGSADGLVIATNSDAIITGASGAGGGGGGGLPKLTANTNYYLATTGNDSNDGLTPGAAWLTFERALEEIRNTDTNNFNMIINIAAGTYQTTSSHIMPDIIGGGQVQFTGTGIPIIENTLSNPVLFFDNVTGDYYFFGILFELTSAFSGSRGILSLGKNLKLTLENVDFKQANGDCIVMLGGELFMFGTTSIDCVNSRRFLQTGRHAFVDINFMVYNFDQPTVYSDAFIVGSELSMIQAPNLTFGGSAASVTGKRYEFDFGTIVNTNGGGATYFPGDVAGTVANNALYV